MMAVRFAIDPEHPSLAGHFPQRPIVPGVVLLEHALALLLHDRPECRVAGLDEVKFLAPVLPGQEVTVEVTNAAPGRIAFAGKVAGNTVFRCRAQLGATP